jgi:hypothetical protein
MPRAARDGLIRTYSAGLTADVESTAISSIAGTIIEGRRLIKIPPDVRSCLPEDMPGQPSVYPCNLRRATVDRVGCKLSPTRSKADQGC